MKKGISLFFLVMICLSLCACSSSEFTKPSTESSQSSIESIWTVEYMVDDFNDKTNVSYLRAITTGVFSNTATAGSDLTVAVFMNPAASNDAMISSFAFRLLEYNEIPASYISSDSLTIKIKIGDTIYEDVLIGTPPNGDLLLINTFNDSSEVYKQMYNALVKETAVRCVIELGSSKYSFTVDSLGFVAAANAMMKTYGYDSYVVSTIS